jgi:hypothetical protein
MLVLHSLGVLSFINAARDREMARSLMAACVLGAPISAAAAGHMLERYERRRTNADMSLVRFAMSFAGSVGGLAICLAALAFAATTQLLMVAACGFAIVASLAIIRRLGVSPWFSAAAAATAVIAVVAVVSAWPGGHGDLTLRYADASARSVAVAETMMADASWTGSGGGAYGALLPIYREFDDVAGGLSAPTAAAKISVELGKPGLWTIVAMIVLAVGYLLRGALTRGRDSFYAIAVASSVVVFTLEAFCDTSGLATSVGALMSAAFGLGVAQSVSRSI